MRFAIGRCWAMSSIMCCIYCPNDQVFWTVQGTHEIAINRSFFRIPHQETPAWIRCFNSSDCIGLIALVVQLMDGSTLTPSLTHLLTCSWFSCVERKHFTLTQPGVFVRWVPSMRLRRRSAPGPVQRRISGFQFSFD